MSRSLLLVLGVGGESLLSSRRSRVPMKLSSLVKEEFVLKLVTSMAEDGMRSRVCLDEAPRRKVKRRKVMVATASGVNRNEDQAYADETEVSGGSADGEA